LTNCSARGLSDYEYFRAYFAGGIDAVDRRLRVLRDVGGLGYDSLEALIDAAVQSRSAERLASLESLLEAINESTYQRLVMTEEVRLLSDEYGPAHPDTLMVRERLLEMDEGPTGEAARREWGEIAELWRQNGDNARAARALVAPADALDAQERVRVYDEALTEMRAAVGSGSPPVELARLLVRRAQVTPRQQLRDREPLLLEAVGLLPKDDRAYLACRTALADLQLELGPRDITRLVAAEAGYREVLEMVRKQQGNGHPVVIETLVRLATVLVSAVCWWGCEGLAEARALITEAIATESGRLAPNDGLVRRLEAQLQTIEELMRDDPEKDQRTQRLLEQGPTEDHLVLDLGRLGRRGVIKFLAQLASTPTRGAALVSHLTIINDLSLALLANGLGQGDEDEEEEEEEEDGGEEEEEEGAGGNEDWVAAQLRVLSDAAKLLFEALGRRGVLPSLRTLSVEVRSLEADAMAALGQWEAAEVITALELFDPKGGSDDPALRGLLGRAGEWPSLATLRYQSNIQTDNRVLPLVEALTRGPGAFASLTELDLSPPAHSSTYFSYDVTDEGVAALLGALQRGAAPRLAILNLAHNNLREREAQALAEALSHPGALQNLRELDLSRNEAIGIAGWGLVAGALALPSACPHLSRLKLSTNKFQPASAQALIQALTQPGATQRLTSLDLSYTEGLETDFLSGLASALALPSVLPALQELKLKRMGLKGAAEVPLSSILRSRGLTSLDLSHNHMGDSGVVALMEVLSEGGSPGLEVLRLAGVGCKEKGAEALARALASPSAFRHLAELSLSHNEGLGKDGIMAVTTAVKQPEICPSLRALRLQGMSLDLETLRAVAEALQAAEAGSIEEDFLYNDGVLHVTRCRDTGEVVGGPVSIHIGEARPATAGPPGCIIA
jgi:hypothetical protein